MNTTTDTLEFDFQNHFDRIITLVNEQAEDESLWFNARTAPEAYLQHALRQLHALIEEGG